MRQRDAVVIFDCDGVLLNLTSAEEDLFFAAFEPYCDTAQLGRDWNNYRIRNDDDIVDEIIATTAIAPNLKPIIVADYISSLQVALHTNALFSQAIVGAAEMLHEASHIAHLGLATANYLAAAKLRLEAASLWNYVKDMSFGADGGGHKQQILGRALATLNVPRSRIVYVGDNLNDITAGLQNGVHFIGFSTDPTRLEQLRGAGVQLLGQNHSTTLQHIRSCLG